jgi:hypothetical protein
MGPNEREMSQINLFREVVDACQLGDLSYIGLDWTFERRLPSGKYCRVHLDRALASGDWSERFPFASVEHLHVVKSDHSPILLMNEMDSQNQRIAIDKPFRYEVMWERHDDFKQVLEAAWGSFPASNVQELQDKISATTRALVGWGTITFGAVRPELRQLRRWLQDLQSDQSKVVPSYEEKKVDERIAELCYREEITWKQRARVQWLAKGDMNTLFSPKGIKSEEEEE